MADTKQLPVELDRYVKDDCLFSLTHWSANSYDIDCWKGDENHWNRNYRTEELARAEFERWRK